MRVLNIDEDPYIRETYMAPGKMDGPQPFEFLQQGVLPRFHGRFKIIDSLIPGGQYPPWLPT